MTKNIKTIPLPGNFMDSRVTVLNRKSRGELFREKHNFEILDQDNDIVICFLIDDHIDVITQSFWLGVLQKSYKNISNKEKFKNKFVVQAYSKHLEKNFDEALDAASMIPDSFYQNLK